MKLAWSIGVHGTMADGSLRDRSTTGDVMSAWKKTLQEHPPTVSSTSPSPPGSPGVDILAAKTPSGEGPGVDFAGATGGSVIGLIGLEGAPDVEGAGADGIELDSAAPGDSGGSIDADALTVGGAPGGPGRGASGATLLLIATLELRGQDSSATATNALLRRA